ncbi:MAG: AAA family ATPase, partial [Caldisericia bacterium]|nr:AAA family ATPase [Caldisericia bacterium]
MCLTEEQLSIIDQVKKHECKLLKIEAKSGSGKSSTLVEIAKALNPKTGLYLAFNKHIVVEMTGKMPSGITIQTTHSLAYQNTVKPLKLKVGFFKWKDIKTRMIYIHKLLTIDTMNDFFLSKHTTFEEFKEEHRLTDNMDSINPAIYKAAYASLKEMFSGKVDITHAGYLKMYHMMLSSGKIHHKELDIVMLDEFQDSAPVVLEIFRLLPAKKKVVAGDNFQSIFKFNQCVNGFDEFANEGYSLPMTQTFRCNPELAERVQTFMRRHADPHFQFIGTEPETKAIESVMHISRTNSALVGKIIDLMEEDIGFNMARKASIVFELVLILLQLKPDSNIYSGEWRHLQADVDEWENDDLLKRTHRTALSYIAKKYEDEIPIKSAVGIITNYGPRKIFGAYNFAKAHEKEKNHKVTIGTAHSLKGAEADRVYILDDVNNSIRDLIDEDKPLEDYTEE